MTETEKNISSEEEKEFTPIFIVGAPRSGTTMLAVLLDRHSCIAIPPETAFFFAFLPTIEKDFVQKTHQEILDLALNFKRIADLNIENRDSLLKRFEGKTKTMPSLLQSILEEYAKQRNKSRVGEKSPQHILSVPTILSAYPKSKVICIIRDGRDVVSSLLKVPWALPGNPRRFGLFCSEWTELGELALKYEKEYPSDRFTCVKYEDILLRPREELIRLCEFIGEEFEESQLDSETQSQVVPKWEKGWKEKANSGIDASRIAAWRKADQQKIWEMNSRMGKMLSRLGYPDSGLQGCPFRLRIYFALSKIPYWKPLRPFVLIGLKVMRSFRALFQKT